MLTNTALNSVIICPPGTNEELLAEELEPHGWDSSPRKGDLNGKKKYLIIRNPVARVKSMYLDYRREGGHLEFKPWLVNTLPSSSLSFLGGNPYEDILRYEQMEADIIRVFDVSINFQPERVGGMVYACAQSRTFIRGRMAEDYKLGEYDVV